MKKVIIIETANYALAMAITIMKLLKGYNPIEFFLMFLASTFLIAVIQMERHHKHTKDYDKYTLSIVFCAIICANSIISLILASTIEILEISLLVAQIAVIAYLCKLKWTKDFA